MPWDRSAASPELRLIAATIAEIVGRQAGRCEAVLATGAPDWILFLTLALEHNVGGIVAAALALLPAGRVPPAVVAALVAHRRHAGESNRAALDEQRRLLAALDAAGIPAVPFKGAWLCLRAYRDLAARPSQDIDFLVPAASVAPMLPVLQRCGYDVTTGLSPWQLRATIRDDCEFMFPRQDRRWVIEPHWNVVPRNLALTIDLAGIWQRLRSVTVGHECFRTLAREDEVILLCVHGGKEEWARFKWLADLAAFVMTSPALDWTVVARRAREMHARRIVELGVLLLHEAFAIDTPLLQQSMRDRAVRHYAAEVARRMGAAAAARGVVVPIAVHRISAMRLRLCQSRFDKLRYVVRTIMTPRRIHFTLVPLPDPLHPLYIVIKVAIDYALHPISLICKRLIGRVHAPTER